ncbi:hypothetical protein A4G99_21965 [Haladaptatus sp. R4]|uniref:hypothetical protein n=1 Tax=Haladaptatus sp. R4 TaxID=1679489 RepID=UPI0007B4A253|nr:hypothetical protein [Haladaptatus sp. R4]KZN26274.1 hypothetical protein A4G99_21965 [Haladaptatus sp. R4]
MSVEADHGQTVSLLLAVRQSFIAFVTMLGVVFWVLALLLSGYVPFVTNGVLSGMLAILGTSAFVYAIFGHLGLRLIGYN